MKKVFVIAATAAAVLAAGCAKNEVIQNQDQTPISFGVYAGKTATKAVSGTDFGTVTTNSLGKEGNAGFGIFGYYTGNDSYANNTIANFMYNEHVTGNGTGSTPATTWTYSPVKYWPNEHGPKAVSANSDVDKLTFLAYAPWVDLLTLGTNGASTVKGTDDAAATEGILFMTGNQEANDALLIFKVPASTKEQIDLLYGTLGATYSDVENRTVGVVEGPIENLTKQKTNGNVNILFKHSLAKVAFDIKTVVDQVSPESSVGHIAKGTKVVVKSLTLKGTDIGTQGNLNLYSGNWNVTTKVTSFGIAPLPTSIAVDAAPTSYPSIDGVDENGLGNTVDVMLIPETGAKFTGIDIVYYVCTSDSKLQNEVSVIENHISKDFGTAISIVKGSQYNITVLLGLTSVNLSASVEDWNVVTPSTNIDLPQNVTPAP